MPRRGTYLVGGTPSGEAYREGPYGFCTCDGAALHAILVGHSSLSCVSWYARPLLWQRGGRELPEKLTYGGKYINRLAESVNLFFTEIVNI